VAFLQDAGVGLELHTISAEEDELLNEDAEGRVSDG
jgi:hypothetical protein